MWRGHLPHWRAEDVVYYVRFRYRRELEAKERAYLMGKLLRPDGRMWNLEILYVGPDETQLIFRVKDSPKGAPYELSEIVEKAKTKAGKQIIKDSGERLPPFYGESFDRIIRDEAEYEERWQALFEIGCDESEESFLYVPEKS
jgi:hypothetical protein